MINKYFQISSLVLATCLGAFAHAERVGGVGSGGGGTTVPDPSSADEIAQALQEESRFVIEAWFNRQEKNYSEQPADIKAQNPLRKFFESKTGISQLLASTPVELRMTRSCFNSVGQPVDGSIYGSREGSLCMSPSSMAPKLSIYNYKAESFALLVHEFSHLLGADESEAVAIQKMALKDFLTKDPADLKLEMESVMWRLSRDLIDPLSLWISNPEILKSQSDQFSSLLRSFQEVDVNYNSDGRYLLVSFKDDAYMAAEYIRHGVLDAFICFQDQNLGEQRQNFCKSILEESFQGTSSATVADIVSNRSIIMDRLNPEIARAIYVQKPVSWQILSDELGAARNTFVKIKNDLDRRMNSQIITY